MTSYITISSVVVQSDWQIEKHKIERKIEKIDEPEKWWNFKLHMPSKMGH